MDLIKLINMHTYSWMLSINVELCVLECTHKRAQLFNMNVELPRLMVISNA